MDIKHIAKILFNRIFLKPVQPKGDIEIIECNSSDIEFRYGKHHLTATNPIRLNSPNGYFRECKKHLTAKDYVKSITEEFFTEILPACYENGGGYLSEYQKITTLLDDADNFKKFMRLEKRYGNSPLMQFHRNKDYDAIGLKGAENLLPWEIINTFAWYSSSHIAAYWSSYGCKYGDWQTYNASRGISSYQVAKVLGLESYIPKTKYVKLSVNEGRNRFGTFMEVAQGTHYNDYSKYDSKHVVTPSLQKSLTNLNLLDAVMYERDHRLDNYNVIFDENGYATGICAYDNDASYTLFVSPSPEFYTYKGCCPFIKDGVINRPHLDRTLAMQVLSVKRKDIYNALDGFGNALQKWACWKRVRCIQQAIRSTIKCNPNFLADDNIWSQQTIDDELSGKYGKTYLCLMNESFQK